jgi:tRNA A37 threonylcarbamoyladenosine modification protein TsaB
MKSLLVISIAQPLLVGIYENKQLIKIISKEGKTSDILPIIIKNVLEEYTIDELIYVNGPGSYMAIKIAYIFLKTLSIAKSIPLYALDGFSLNHNSPIKALGKKYFIKKNGVITIDFIDEDTLLEDFTLPKSLETLSFKDDTLPEYHLPAVI